MAKKSKYIRQGSPDFFRSITTIAGMMHVNTPGSGEYLFGVLNRLCRIGDKWLVLILTFSADFDSKAMTAYILSMILLIFIHLSWIDLLSNGSLPAYFSPSGDFELLLTPLMRAAFYVILFRIPVYILYTKRIFIKNLTPC